MLAIQVAELRFATQEGVLVFDGLSFGVVRDGFVWVVGPTGSGKTLLLRILLGEVRPHGGQILLLGRNILRLPRRKLQSLRRKIGYMPQEPHALFGRTVLGNLQFKLRALGIGAEARREAVERALDLAGLHGHETDHVENLPQLELKRLELALALCLDCSILFADDPLRNLAEGAKAEFLNVLERVNQAGITILATTSEDETLLGRGFTKKGETRALVYLRESMGR